MAGTTASPAEMITQLEAARKLALGDPQVYTQVVPGILPIIGPAAPIEVRRWGAEFLAEAFASPSLQISQKELLTTDVLPTLKTMLENPGEDEVVIKSAVQASASIYPLVFRRIISHPDQGLLWHDMTMIKSSILKRMDNAPLSVRMCCIKFVQKVVQVQTPGLITDPRRHEQNETSIALVPRNHPLLPLQNVEAETYGLLDRLLGVFQEHSTDPLMVDATLNCMAVLIKTRPPIANKIISTILNFNPFTQATSPITPRVMVIVRSMEKTIRLLLKHILRMVPNNPLEQKIHSYLSRLQQSKTALFSDTHSLKRPAEPTDGLDQAKRQRLTIQPRKFPPMPPAPHTLAHLFTLTEDTMIHQFDVKLLPADIVSSVTGVLLQHLDQSSMNEAIDAVKARYTHLQKASKPTPVPDVPMAGPTGIDDEDDYDPELIGSADSSINPATEHALEELVQPIIELGPFELPKPPPLTGLEVALLSDQTLGHVFQVIGSFDSIQAPARQKLGLSRLAASTNDREGWLTILTRIATRAPVGLEDVIAADRSPEEEQQDPVKRESNAGQDVEEASLANRIRQMLFMYILDDFRSRLNIAISWLHEEWYSDKLVAKVDPNLSHLPNYSRWAGRLLDRLLPYLDAKDKNLLIRFLSEIPALNPNLLESVRSLARDPERISMCILALQYLLLMRPPVREMVIDAIENIWVDGDPQAQSATMKVLNKWRPNGIISQGQSKAQAVSDRAVKKEDAIDGKKRPAIGSNAVSNANTNTNPKLNGLKSPLATSDNFDPMRKKMAVTAGDGNTR